MTPHIHHTSEPVDHQSPPGLIRALVEAVQGWRLAQMGRLIPGDMRTFDAAIIEATRAKVQPDHSLKANRLRHVRTVLDMCGGDRTKAAKLLGIGRSAMHRYVRQCKTALVATISLLATIWLNAATFTDPATITNENPNLAAHLKAVRVKTAVVPVAPVAPTNVIAAPVYTKLAAVPAPGASGRVNLAWIAPDDPTVVGYRIYYGGTSGNYTNSLSVSNVTTATLTGLVEAQTLYFAVVSRNELGVESLFSNEISAFIQPVASLTPVVWRYSTRLPAKAGTNVFQASTNLTTWTSIFTNFGGGIVSFNRTNTSAEFVRLK